MAEHTTTEKLAALAACIDQAAEDRGWNCGHLFVRVEDLSGEEFDYGIKELDDHPLEYLLGFEAPPEWSALGVCCEGWAARMGSGPRPSKAKGRMRVRSTTIVTRDGLVASGLRLAGEDYQPQ